MSMLSKLYRNLYDYANQEVMGEVTTFSEKIAAGADKNHDGCRPVEVSSP